MADQARSTDSADLLGRLEAEQFDRRLRDRERQELAERWPRTSLGSAGESAPAPGRPLDLETQHQFEQLVRYQLAVQSSRAWRLVQALRRPFGRQW